MTRPGVVDTHAHFWAAPPSSEMTIPSTDRPVSASTMVDLMDGAGVARMLQVTRYFDGDDDYSIAGALAYPTRFRVIGKYDPILLAEPELLASWAAPDFIIGLRVFTLPTDVSLFTDAAEPFWRMIEQLGLPVSIYTPGYLKELRDVAASFPAARIVIDHAGTSVFASTSPEHRFDDWNDALALSELDNIFVKASGLPEATLESFPFPRAQKKLRELCQVFGSSRTMWGSNFTPAGAVGSYGDLVEFARLAVSTLSDQDQTNVLEAAAGEIFGLASWLKQGSSASVV